MAAKYPLIEGIDIHNPSPTHEANAAFLRSFPIDRAVFRLYARSPGTFLPIMSVLDSILSGEKRTIQLLDYQLIVLRMTGLINAEYLFGINEPISRLNGLGDDKIEALRKGLSSKELIAMGTWTERQQCLLTLVEESIRTYDNNEETILWAKRVMTDDEVVECFVVLGFYTTIARMTKGLRVQKDPVIPHLETAIVDTITKNEKDGVEA
ncbi:hypothetical protein ASPTUDRAFT_32486 [Aspergillus tubingensis CBS 134.48]|uniref:Carboxymuconolactone decarboxylase-like domain-containing protein n=1 Tax=Aspergillus tubingensis (strain CBS 134.48) TaxID=767770 RepID=A0A1L9MVH9_ASPTC|nr:hypothetical protein ASPTUDRAFT_32486 [Aspergillus tubingensis CBS 134.48]